MVLVNDQVHKHRYTNSKDYCGLNWALKNQYKTCWGVRSKSHCKSDWSEQSGITKKKERKKDAHEWHMDTYDSSQKWMTKMNWSKTCKRVNFSDALVSFYNVLCSECIITQLRLAIVQAVPYCGEIWTVCLLPKWSIDFWTFSICRCIVFAAILLRPLTGGNWQKWKRVFLTCPCHEIYRDEAVGL